MSSSSEPVVITGELKQTVVQGGVFQPVIFSNVNKGYRQTQNIYYLNVSHSGEVLVVDGTVPLSASVGVSTENIYVDGTVYTIEITVVAAVSSSSEQPGSSAVESSSSAESSSSVSTEWAGNAQLTNASDNGVTIGSTNDWVSERVITKNLGVIIAKEMYTLSFDVTLLHNTMDVDVSLGGQCNQTLSLSASAGDLKYSCTFVAKNDGDAVLTLTMPGSRWEQVTVANLSLRNGMEPESSSSSVVVESSSSVVESSSSRPQSSSSSKPHSSSSSHLNSSSSSQPSSSEEESSSSAESGETLLMVESSANPLGIALDGRLLHVSGASLVAVDVFDMQGRPVVSFRNVSGAVNLGAIRQGGYVVRVRSGSFSLVRRVTVK